ncbi:MAG: hypothetical protein EA350_08390 [Gemmatimonadales bacterium]|nr:MAG: hypothetical protein EA350_08390 [Gemmatimonadales bacterium]
MLREGSPYPSSAGPDGDSDRTSANLHPRDRAGDPAPARESSGGPGGMRRLLLSGALLFLPGVSCHPALEVDRERVQPDVLTTLHAGEEAAVMIALTPPPGFGDPAADQERIRAEISRMQAEVLSAVDTADFRPRQPFLSIPAMAGTLRTERGLRTLLEHRYVRRVDLDPAGGGGQPPVGGQTTPGHQP